MSVTAEGRGSTVPSERPDVVPALSRFDRSISRISAVSPWLVVVVIAGLIAVIWAIVYGAGGTKGAWPHLFYLPIILAAVPFGTRGALATAVTSGIVCGPLIPVDTVTGEPQPVGSMLLRGAMFVAVAGMAAVTMALRQRLDAERVSRDLREAMIGTGIDQNRVDPALVPLIGDVLDRRVFHPVFQPIYSLGDGHLIAVEALTRFDIEPVRTPDTWFAAAHHVGRGADLELAAIEEAVAAAVGLPQDVELWLNISPTTVAHPRLRKLIESCGKRTIALELSEHAIVADYDVLEERLERVRCPGVQIAVDDAGAGFSSLRHIVRLSPEITKLDISLAQDLASSPVRRALGEAMIAFAHHMNGLLVVEGIETVSDLTAWAALGADAVQGYLLGYPGPLPVETLSSVVTSVLRLDDDERADAEVLLPSPRRGE